MPTKFTTMLLCLFGIVPLLYGQGSRHNLEDTPGQENKKRYPSFLTLNQTDEWIFDGEQGETIIAHVTTKEFDPILGIAKKIENLEDQVLHEVDDEGSQSRFVFRLKEKGRFAIRVNAFKNQGGGNYELTVERFLATPIKIGDTVAGSLDKKGKAYHYFDAKKGQIVVPTLLRDSSASMVVLSTKGVEISNWSGSYSIEEDGEYRVVLSGREDRKYELILREARLQTLEVGKEFIGTFRPGEMDVWSFAAKPGDVRLLEIEGGVRLNTRLIEALLLKKNERVIDQTGELEGKAIESLPVASRGDKLRYAVILGRDTAYQFHVLASAMSPYKLKMVDPRTPIEFGESLRGVISVGGAAFYRFPVSPGQLFHLKLASKQFVPVLRLCDSKGETLQVGDLFEEDLTGQITHMVTKGGDYLIQISSLGDGGGGEFQLELTETKLKELKIGGRYAGKVAPGQTEFWTLDGKEGQVFFIHARSGKFAPSISVQNPDGERVLSNEAGSQQTGTLLALSLTKSGRYTIGISSGRDAGEYSLRTMDAE